MLCLLQSRSDLWAQAPVLTGTTTSQWRASIRSSREDQRIHVTSSSLGLTIETFPWNYIEE